MKVTVRTPDGNFDVFGNATRLHTVGAVWHVTHVDGDGQSRRKSYRPGEWLSVDADAVAPVNRDLYPRGTILV